MQVQLFATALLLPTRYRAPPGGHQQGLCDTETTARSEQTKHQQPARNSSCPLPTFFIPAGAFPVLSSWIDYNDFLPLIRITNRHAPWSSPLTFRTSSRRGTLQHPGPRAQSRMPSPPDDQIPRLHIYADNHPRSSNTTLIPNLRRHTSRPIRRHTNNPHDDGIPLPRRRVRQGSARRRRLSKTRRHRSRENMGPTMSGTQRTNPPPGEKSTRLH